MPEVGIGFFPDVGGTYFLPRLAASRRRLFRADRPARRRGRRARLRPGRRPSSRAPPSPRSPRRSRATTTSTQTLARFAAPPPPSPLMVEADGLEACFSSRTAARRSSRRSKAAEAQGPRLRRAGARRDAAKSRRPARRSRCGRWRSAPRVDFDEALRIEYRIVSRICRGHDFYEGVRAVIVDKDNRPPGRPPPSAAEVDAYFAPARRPTN